MAFTSLRVMTYNVDRCRGRSQAVDPDAIFDVIAAAAPDVAALQEIDCRSGALDALAARLGMRAYTAGDGGVGFLSYYALRGCTYQPLGAGGEILKAELDLGQKRMSLYNLHLAGNGRDGVELADFICGRRSNLPSLILGDFGPSPLDPAWRCRQGGSPLRRMGSPLLHGTYPSALPLLCRDRAYVCGDLQPLCVNVVRSRPARRASTHLPLLVTVRIIDPRLYLKVEAPSGRGLEIAPG